METIIVYCVRYSIASNLEKYSERLTIHCTYMYQSSEHHFVFFLAFLDHLWIQYTRLSTIILRTPYNVLVVVRGFRFVNGTLYNTYRTNNVGTSPQYKYVHSVVHSILNMDVAGNGENHVLIFTVATGAGISNGLFLTYYRCSLFLN